MSSENEDSSAVRRRVSCTKCFDALWFCYSPFYQMQQYYRVGRLDDCTKKFSDLFDCLSLKTKKASEAESKRWQMRQNISGLCEHRKKLQVIGMRLLGIWMIQTVRRYSLMLSILYCILDGDFYFQETRCLLEVCRLFCRIEKAFCHRLP